MKFITLFCFLMFTSVAWAVDSAGLSQLRAAFVLQFTRYVEWPEKSEKIKVGVVDDDLFFSQAAGMIKERNFQNIELTKIDKGSDKVNDLQFYKMIVLSPGEGSRQNQIAESVRGKSILVVTFGNSEKLKNTGVNFYVEDDHVRFEIHTKNLSDSKLKLGAQLMRLGKVVED